MPTVTIQSDAPITTFRGVRWKAGGLVIDLPWWPEEVQDSNAPPAWNEVERPGRTPLLLRQAEGLSEKRVTMIVSWRSRDGKNRTSVEESNLSILNDLVAISQHRMPVSIVHGSRAIGQWRITDMGMNHIEWTSKGEPSITEVSFTLKAASDASVPVGPIKKRNTRGRGR